MRKSRTEIRTVADILTCISHGDDRVSAILRKANVTHRRLEEILGRLAEQGLVSSQDEGDYVRYAVEPKGHQFLAEYRQFRYTMEQGYGIQL